MKRSRQIRLLLLGGFCGGAFPACSPDPDAQLAPAPKLYPNDHYVERLGYYHAPYHAWYPQPYNHLDARKGQYFHGGFWTREPHASVVNLSEPNPDALRALEAATQVRRSGFGYTGRSGSHFFS